MSCVLYNKTKNVIVEWDVYNIFIATEYVHQFKK